MSRVPQSGFGAFTAEEHLQVHQQVEQRAHELWCQRGNCSDNTLHNWLEAEAEIVARFIRIRTRYAWKAATDLK